MTDLNLSENTPTLVGNSLFQYIMEVNKIPMLTEDEELRYAKEIQQFGSL